MGSDLRKRSRKTSESLGEGGVKLGPWLWPLMMISGVCVLAPCECVCLSGPLQPAGSGSPALCPTVSETGSQPGQPQWQQLQPGGCWSHSQEVRGDLTDKLQTLTFTYTSVQVTDDLPTILSKTLRLILISGTRTQRSSRGLIRRQMDFDCPSTWVAEAWARTAWPVCLC